MNILSRFRRYWLVSKRFATLATIAILSIPALSSIGEDRPSDSTLKLASQIEPWISTFQLQRQSFTIQGTGTVLIDNQSQSIQLKLVRHSDEAFDLTLEHPQYALTLVRRKDVTVVALPKHRKLFWGHGPVDPKDHLDSKDLGRRVIRASSEIAVPFDFLRVLDANALSELALGNTPLREQSQAERAPGESSSSDGWISDGNRIRFETTGKESSLVAFEGSGISASLELSTSTEDQYPRSQEATFPPWISQHWGDYDAEELDREEIEKTIVRGLRRAAEVLAPSSRLTDPTQKNRETTNGELRWLGGQRVALLWGTPEQIGTAHGELLKAEANRCIDSVLYGFGFVQTIANGRWFRADLDRAYQELKPHIPARHIAETRALARALEIDEHLMEILNVFPELFHCSGFAMFGSATTGGKLYHGRVLDYMTEIGLQDAATTFIVAPDGQIPFANIGYAGFTGSVSGMNAEKISLGEMGGRGEGKWQGVPMATLMRRALEECDSLDKVTSLWSDSPRTCEYYYVFADGETKSAVAVSATPEAIEFVKPGQPHPQLGEGIKDSVVISAGSRLDELRRRVIEQHGNIGQSEATQLMCRPVAMNSNLHNVLFIPEDGKLLVSNASHSKPAADCPYVELDLHGLIQEIRNKQGITEVAATNAFQATDSLQLNLQDEPSVNARECLDGLKWDCSEFPVRIEDASDKLKSHGYDRVVRFPSPIPSGDPINDSVAMEWYPARVKGKQLANAPAIVVVHESGRGMTVGKLIARGLSKQGIHALMLQLPTYGLRRNQANIKSEGETLVSGLKQGIADARRAYDAVRVLPGVDPSRISIQGTSLGGFVVATTTGLDSAYHRSIVLLAGGDLYGVLARGDRDAAKARRELEQSGISMDQAKQSLYTIEPLRLAHRVAPEKTWLFSGTHDTVVPPENSKAFATAAKLPDGHHVEMPADHYSGVVFLPSVIVQMASLASEMSAP